jgi:LDH2 family malate/lactate/ureidoglycolate dehydrogenase
MITISATVLHRFAKQILMAAGTGEPHAERVAAALVSSNLAGVDTHGIWHLPQHVQSLRNGEIDPSTEPEIAQETPASALVKGNWCFGHVTAKYGMEVAIAKAKEQGVAVVGMVELPHVGRVGEYAEMATAHDLIATIWAGGFAEKAPAAAPYGGKQRLLHTNPLAIGFPVADEPPIIIDFATTAISGVKIELARSHHKQLAPGSIIDKDGNPTTDPNAFFDGGAHIPFGGYKGYALMLAAEYFGRILTGSDQFADQPRGGVIFGFSGMTAMVVRADLFRPFAAYTASADEMRRRAQATPPAPGFEQVLVPGDLESAARAARQRNGIPVEDLLWQQLVDLAQSLNVEVP